MRQLIERWGLRQPILDLAESGAPIFGTCAGMIVLSSRHRRRRAAHPAAARRDRRAQRLRPAARLVRGGADRRPSSVTGRSTPCSSGPRSSSAPGPASTSWPASTTAGSSRSASGTSLATAFHPELAGETRFHRLVATMAAEHDDPGEGVGPTPPSHPAGPGPMTATRPPRRPGKVRAARLTDLAALGELSRLCQSGRPGDALAGPAGHRPADRGVQPVPAAPRRVPARTT